MQITFHGAAGTVTGSQHLIEVNGKKILLDYGLFQGRRKEAFELNRQGFSDGTGIDCVVLSHAHIDHSGNIPSLVRKGFMGDIYSTAATRDLCAAMLLDSAHIQERDVDFVNRGRSRAGKNLFEPLYSSADAARIMGQFVSIGYHRSHTIAPGVALTFFDAGHMLGSAHVLLEIDEKDSGRHLRLVFSGDIGRRGIPIIRDPEPVAAGADILIMESTYGGRLHPGYGESEAELGTIAVETFRRGGVLLVPAFAVGRTQQIVLSLHRLYAQGKVPAMPVFVDSPLAADVTEVFRRHPDLYDKDLNDFLDENQGSNPFAFRSLRYTRTVEESKALNSLKMPAVIIAASGMMEHGRILHHLRGRIADHRTTILVSGWQAPYTLGRRLVEGESRVNLLGEEHRVKAQVRVLNGFSGHADADELVAWAGAMSVKPQKSFIVHGEQEAAQALKENLAACLGFENIEIPQPHQSFTV